MNDSCYLYDRPFETIFLLLSMTAIMQQRASQRSCKGTSPNVTAILFKTLSLDRSSSPLFRRNLVWSYRLTSCCDSLPLFFRYRPNGFCNDNENVWSGVTAVGDAPLGALSRRKTLGCRRVIETNGTVWVSIAAPEKSMRTASTPDKRNVSLRPVVTV